MKDETLIGRLREAHAQLERLKSQWYDLKLPFAHYSSDFVPILALASLSLSDEELLRRLREAHEQYRRQHNDSNSPLSFFNSDTVPLLLVVGLPAEEEVPAGVVPAIEEPIIAVPVAEPAAKVPVPETVAPAPIAVEEVVVVPVIIEPETVAPPAPTADECSHFGGCNDACLAKQAESPSTAVEPEQRPCPHVGADGKCLGCTSDRLETCASCTAGEDQYPVSELTKCKDEECANYFCSGCREEYLGESGYCSEHSTVTCNACKQDIDRDAEICCRKKSCSSGIEYCAECAKRLFTENGHCSECSGEDIGTCDECDLEFIDSRLTSREDDDREYSYCLDCLPNHPGDVDFDLEDEDEDDEDVDFGLEDGDEDEEDDEDSFV